jgi:hypothetical protein
MCCSDAITLVTFAGTMATPGRALLDASKELSGLQRTVHTVLRYMAPIAVIALVNMVIAVILKTFVWMQTSQSVSDRVDARVRQQ